MAVTKHPRRIAGKVKPPGKIIPGPASPDYVAPKFHYSEKSAPNIPNKVSYKTRSTRSLYLRVPFRIIEILNELVERHNHLGLKRNNLVCMLIDAAHKENWQCGSKFEKNPDLEN